MHASGVEWVGLTHVIQSAKARRFPRSTPFPMRLEWKPLLIKQSENCLVCWKLSAGVADRGAKHRATNFRSNQSFVTYLAEIKGKLSYALSVIYSQQEQLCEVINDIKKLSKN